MNAARAVTLAFVVACFASACRDDGPPCCPMHEDESNFCFSQYDTGRRNYETGWCVFANVYGRPNAGYEVAYAPDGCPYWTGPGDPATGICPYPSPNPGIDTDIPPDTTSDAEIDLDTDDFQDTASELDADDVADSAADGSASGADATGDGSGGEGSGADAEQGDAP